MFARRLGRSDIQVSAMGLGCYAIGGPFWRADHGSVSWQEDDGQQFPGGWGQVDMVENASAMEFGPLSEEQAQQIDALLGWAEV